MAKALQQASGGDITTLSAYNQRAIAKDPSLAARFGVTAPSSSSADNAPGTLGYYTQQADTTVAPAYNTAASEMTTAAKTEQQGYATEAANVMAEQPLIQQTYANLAAELTSEQTQETGVALQQGEQNIGGVRAQQASQGVSTAGSEAAQGSFAAPMTAAEQQRSAQVASIASKYGVQQTELQSQLNSDISGLIDKANSYTQQGNDAMATLSTNLANLKLQQTQEELTLAQSYLSAQTQDEKDQLEEDKLDQTIAHQDQQMQLAEETLANTAKHEAATEAIDQEKTVLSTTNVNAAVKGIQSIQKQFTPPGQFGNLPLDVKAQKQVSSMILNLAGGDTQLATRLLQEAMATGQFTTSNYAG